MGFGNGGQQSPGVSFLEFLKNIGLAILMGATIITGMVLVFFLFMLIGTLLI